MKKIILFFFIINFHIISQSATNFKITEFGVFNFAERNQLKPNIEIKKERMDNKTLAPCFSHFKLPRNGYKFQINETSTIVTKKGLRVTIPPGAFLYSNFAYASGVGTLYVYEVTEPFEYMIAGVNHIYYDKQNRINYLELAGMFRIEVFQDNNRLRLANDKKIQVEFPDLAPGKKIHYFMLDDTGNWTLKNEFGTYEIFKPQKTSDANHKYTGTRKGTVEYLTWYAFGIPHLETTSLKVEWEDPKKIAGRNFQVVVIGIDHISYFMKWTDRTEIILPAFQNKTYRLYLCDDLGNYSTLDEFTTTSKVGYDYLPDSSDNFRQVLPILKIEKFPRENLASTETFKSFMKIPSVNYQVLYKDLE